MTDRADNVTKLYPNNAAENPDNVLEQAAGAEVQASQGAAVPQRIVDLAQVAAFLAWAEREGEMWGGVHAKDAMESFCRLIGVDKEATAAVALGEREQ